MGQFRTKWMPIGIATILHFLVDGLCVCLLYLMAEKLQDASDVVAMFLTYNVLAFMTQPLTGWWVDRLQKRQTALLLSSLLLSSAAILAFSFPRPLVFLLASILLGMGNSLFHVWGGKLSATQTANDMRALGIFVSTGVLGLTVGVLYASWGLLAGMLLLIILLGLISMRMQTVACEAFSPLPSVPEPAMRLCFWLLVILVFVLTRSYVGEVIQVGTDRTPHVLLLLALTAMGGKALGGWLARWWGMGQAIVACLGIAAACLMWRGADCVPLLPIVAGVFAINCTMPMTLCLSNRLLPQREGLSFGLLAAVLIPGYLLAKSLPLPSEYSFMLPALLLTIAIEVGMLMLMGEKRRGVLIGAVVVNMLTNVPLNYFLLTFEGGTEHLIMGELLVLLVEAVWYYLFVRQWRKAAIYSLLCNATSFLVGVLLQYIISYSL